MENQTLIKRKSVGILGIIVFSIFAIGGVGIAAINPIQYSTIPVIDEAKVGGEGVQVTGWVKITVLDEFGNVKSVHEDYNLIHTGGLGATSDLLFGTTHVSGESVGGFDNISLGSSSAALNASHTDCQTQAGHKLADASPTNSGSIGAVINQSWVAVLGTVTIEEICLTDSITNATGNMYARQLTGSISVLPADTVNAEWTITFADSDAS